MKFHDALNSSEAPKTSVILITYNHEAFIGDCLTSILSQEVDHSVELIITDDCSNDSTVSVIEKLLPKKAKNIKKHYHEKNLFNEKVFNLDRIKSARGNAFFYIEGDDFWSGSSNRIQKMTDCLNNDPSIALCFTDTFQKCDEGPNKSQFLLPENLKTDIAQNKLRLANYSFMHLGACCFRNVRTNFPQEYKLSMNSDLWFPYLWSEFGDARYLDDCGHLAYRYNGEGAWSSQNEQEKIKTKLIYACQLTSHMLRTGNLDGAIFNSFRFRPLLDAREKLGLDDH